MSTFRVSIRRPTTEEPIWDFAQTVVALDEKSAFISAYNTWIDDNPTPPPPAMDLCQWQAIVVYPVVVLDEMVSTFRNSLRSNLRSTALLATDNSSDDLFSMVQASKAAPGSTSLAVVDTTGPATSNGKPTQDALAIYNDMLSLSSLANVVATKKIYDSQRGYNRLRHSRKKREHLAI